MTASLPYHRPGQQAAHLTSMVRMRLQQKAAPLPRADWALLKAMLLILTAGALATALAVYLTHRRDEPVTVAEAAPAAKDGVAIPQEPVVPTTVQIDPARLARLRLETAEVSSLLAGIFAEEEAPVAPPAVAETTSARFEGLDVAHSELLGAVVDACGLDRATFDTRAKALKLLPDGAIETINDWAFDRFDEPVLEGDDDLTCPEPLRLQLLALDLAA